MKCHVMTYGDTTKCHACGLEWDTGDANEPVCRVQQRAIVLTASEFREDAERLKRRAAVAEGCLLFGAAILLSYCVGRGLL